MPWRNSYEVRLSPERPSCIIRKLWTLHLFLREAHRGPVARPQHRRVALVSHDGESMVENVGAGQEACGFCQTAPVSTGAPVHVSQPQVSRCRSGKPRTKRPIDKEEFGRRGKKCDMHALVLST